MLSRTAESLFWIGRYLERAEGLARLVDVAYHARLERARPRRRSASYWEPLLTICGERERFFATHSTTTATAVIDFLTFDADNPGSISSCLQCARENANGLRDRITSEMWETLNTFYLWLGERRLLHGNSPGNLHALYSGIKERCHLFHGVAQGTMVHDEGWQFLRLGQFLERAMTTARVLEAEYSPLLAGESGGPAEAVAWMWLLRSLSAYEAYSKAFHVGIRPDLVLEFLVYAPTFPRSIRYAVASAEASLQRVSESPPGRPANAAERILGWLHASLAYADRRELSPERPAPFLRDVQARCAEVSDELGRVYFAYSVPGAYSA